MMLSKALEDMDTRSAKLHMYLCGLRVPEELEELIEYARMEAEAILDRVTYLEILVERGEIPDADFSGPLGAEDRMRERLSGDQQIGVVACIRGMAEGRAPE